MSWNNLKSNIASVVKENGNNEITGVNLQGVLNAIVNNLGANANFAGMAYTDTNPGTPDGPVFYITQGPGLYVNFGNLQIDENIAIVTNTSGTWACVGYLSTDYSFINSLNLLSEAPTKAGFYTDYKQYVENEGFTAIDGYLSVVPGQSYIYTGDLYGTMAISFYDNEENWVDSINVNTTSKMVRSKTDNNGHYTMIQFVVPARATKMLLSSKNTATEFGLFSCISTISRDEVDELKNGLDFLMSKEFSTDAGDFVEGRFYGKANLAVGDQIEMGANSAFSCLKLPVFPGMEVQVSSVGNSIAPAWILTDRYGEILEFASDEYADNVVKCTYIYELGYLYINHNNDNQGPDPEYPQHWDAHVQSNGFQSSGGGGSDNSEGPYLNLVNRSNAQISFGGFVSHDNFLDAEGFITAECQIIPGQAYTYVGDMYGSMTISFYDAENNFINSIFISTNSNSERNQSSNRSAAYYLQSLYVDPSSEPTIIDPRLLSADSHFHQITFIAPCEAYVCIISSVTDFDINFGLFAVEYGFSKDDIYDIEKRAILASGGHLALANSPNIQEEDANFYIGQCEKYVRAGFFVASDGSIGQNQDAVCIRIPVVPGQVYHVKTVGNYAAPPIVFGTLQAYDGGFGSLFEQRHTPFVTSDIIEIDDDVEVPRDVTINCMFVNCIQLSGPGPMRAVLPAIILDIYLVGTNSGSLTIPNTIYAVKGVEKRIYFDSVINDNDKAPAYSIEAISDSNTCISDSRALYILDQNSGSHTVTFEVWNNNKELTNLEKDVEVNVLENVTFEEKRICCVGDSITEGQNMPYYIQQFFLNNLTQDSPQPIFVGSKGGVNGMANKATMHEGWWGRSYLWLAGLIEDPNQPSPFINPNTDSLDIEYYRTNVLNLNSDEYIDVVSFAMGFNTIDNDELIGANLEAMRQIMQAFIDDNPNCTFVIHLVNYPAKGNVQRPQGYSVAAKKQFVEKFRKAILKVDETAEGPFIIGDLGLVYDRHLAAQRSTITPACYSNETLERITDWIHPTAEGAQEMGEGIAPSILKALQGAGYIKISGFSAGVQTFDYKENSVAKQVSVNNGTALIPIENTVALYWSDNILGNLGTNFTIDYTNAYLRPTSTPDFKLGSSYTVHNEGIENIRVTSITTELRGTFQRADITQFVIPESWDCQNVTHLANTFSNCTSLERVDFRGIDTHNWKFLQNTFYNCTSLLTVDFSGCDLSNALYNYSQNMFNGCTGLHTIYAIGCNQATIDFLESVAPQGCLVITSTPGPKSMEK